MAIIRSEEFPLNKQISPPIVNCPPLALSRSHQTPLTRSCPDYTHQKLPRLQLAVYVDSIQRFEHRFTLN